MAMGVRSVESGPREGDEVLGGTPPGEGWGDPNGIGGGSFKPLPD